jgi:hypothetical protein
MTFWLTHRFCNYTINPTESSNIHVFIIIQTVILKKNYFFRLGSENSVRCQLNCQASRFASELHPWTQFLLGTLFAAVFGRNQRQDNKCIESKYDQQSQKCPGEATHDNRQTSQYWYEPQRHNHRYMLLELLIEAFDRTFFSKPCSYAAVATGTRSRVPVSAVRTYKYHNPEGSRRTVCQISSRCYLSPCRAAKAHYKNSRSQHCHSHVRNVIDKLLSRRVFPHIQAIPIVCVFD